MKLFLTTLFVWTVGWSAVVAQQAGTQQPLPDKEIELHVTAKEAQTILNFLSLGQWKDVNPLIVKLTNQVKPQLTPMDPAPNPDEKPH